jgi:predicted signal transduction protein with EAL and GGDEF domain
VAVGLADTAPPPPAIVRLLPLVPVIVIPVAFVAITVKVVELPLVIDVGLAVIVTVGATVAAIAWLLTATPANTGIAHGRSIKRT